MKNLLKPFTLIYLCFIISSPISLAAEHHVIAGAGPSTKIASMFFDLIQKSEPAKQYTFSVPTRSIKHAGGIGHSDTHIFGRTGRPLNDKELGLGKEELLLAGIPIVFIVGNGVKINQLTIKQLNEILSGKITNWIDLGGPNQKIYLVGRESGEASLSVIRNHIPEIDNTHFDLVFSRDHHVINFMETEDSQYTLAFGVSSNFKTDQILNISDTKMSQKIGLVFDSRNRNHPIISLARRYVHSEHWKQILEKHSWYYP